MVAWSHDHSPCYDMVASVSPAALYTLVCCHIIAPHLKNQILYSGVHYY